jgi:uncharacterized protein YggE
MRSMTTSAMIRIAAGVLFDHAAFAQQQTPSAPAQIIVIGSAEILLPATKAYFSIGILS